MANTQVTIEMVSMVIRYPFNKNLFLMHKRNDGRYEFPGGKKESNETFEQASIRETQEETSILVFKQRLLQHMEWIGLQNEKCICEYYLAEHFIGKPTHTEPEKGTDWEWIDFRQNLDSIKSNCVGSLKQFDINTIDNNDNDYNYEEDSQYNLKLVSTIIVNPKNSNELLMHQRNDGKYEFPGGKKEDNETYEQASIRETKEETSINVNTQVFLQKMICIRDGTENEKCICKYYLATNFSGSPQHTEPNKGTKWEWINFKQFEHVIKSNCVASINQFSCDSLAKNYMRYMFVDFCASALSNVNVNNLTG